MSLWTGALQPVLQPWIRSSRSGGGGAYCGHGYVPVRSMGGGGGEGQEGGGCRGRRGGGAGDIVMRMGTQRQSVILSLDHSVNTSSQPIKFPELVILVN